MTGTEAHETMSGASMAGTGTSDWHHWCRLCAKEHSDNVNVYFRDEDQTLSTVLAVAIGKYFWVNIKMEDELSNALCRECYSLMEDLIEFSDRVNRVQTLFTRLQQAGTQTPLRYDELRRECGLLTGEWKHFISINEPTDKTAVDERAADISEYIVDDVVDIFNKPTEIKAEIGATEITENAYETFELTEETAEDANERHIESTQNATTPRDAIPCIEFVDINATTTEAPTNRKEVQETNDQSEVQKSDNETTSKELTANDKRDNTCRFCQKVFTTSGSVNRHILYVHGTDKSDFTCKYCHKEFTTPGSVKRHIMFVHERVKRYVCDCCGKRVTTITGLKEHKLVHTEECPFECPECKRCFKTTYRLKTHLRVHTNNKAIKYKYECNICGVKLKTIRTLKNHKRWHNEKRKFKCDVCGAVFSHYNTLRAHIQVHTDNLQKHEDTNSQSNSSICSVETETEKSTTDFVCLICKAAFKDMSTLKKHYQTQAHYSCNICGKKFKTCRTWQNHKLVHSEVHKYKCDICGAQYKRARSLKEHLLSHTGLRPFICKYCKKGFAVKQSRRTHMLKMHPNEVQNGEDGDSLEQVQLPTLKELRVMSQKLINSLK
ncbi:hypothetical protein KR044_004059 [Drosophila immigrans]|nr:hypothetical protein KR044_004059 [Drosophila immigrans]